MPTICPMKIVCTSQNNPTPRRNVDQEYTLRRRSNRNEMKEMVRLAKLHCDPNKGLSEQPHCELIIHKMKGVAHQGRSIDVEYLIEKFKK